MSRTPTPTPQGSETTRSRPLGALIGRLWDRYKAWAAKQLDDNEYSHVWRDWH